MFQNVNVPTLIADFGPAQGRQSIEGIEIARSGSVVAEVRKRLLQRAERLTQSVRVSDPDLRVQVNGRTVAVQACDSDMSPSAYPSGKHSAVRQRCASSPSSASRKRLRKNGPSRGGKDVGCGPVATFTVANTGPAPCKIVSIDFSNSSSVRTTIAVPKPQALATLEMSTE